MINLNKQWLRLKIQGLKHLKRRSGVQKKKGMLLRPYARYTFVHKLPFRPILLKEDDFILYVNYHENTWMLIPLS